MDASSRSQYSDVLAKMEQRESAARRRMTMYTLAPAVLMAVVLLAYSGWRVTDAAEEVQRLNAEVERLQTDVDEAEARLADAVNLQKFEHPVSYTALKRLYSMYPRAAPVLGVIMEAREAGARWHLGGETPEQGFDSPGFAAWVLERLGVLDPYLERGAGLLTSSRELLDRLPAVEKPEPGDMVFYPAGYALFYFEDEQRSPFVIGMTPFGITSLDPEFSTRVGVRRVEYRR